uniref:Ovule protein n=1 Tax=Heterorhabditis bacteriophora TaxID=37862 RepID=A0A1I7WP26_HETBA
MKKDKREYEAIKVWISDVQLTETLKYKKATVFKDIMQNTCEYQRTVMHVVAVAFESGVNRQNGESETQPKPTIALKTIANLNNRADTSTLISDMQYYNPSSTRV